MSKGFLALACSTLLVFPVLGWGGNESLFKQGQATSWAVYMRELGGMRAICSAIAYKTTPEMTHLLSAGHCFIGSDLKRTDFLVTQDHRSFANARVEASGLIVRTGRNLTSRDLDDYSGDDWAVIKAEIGNKPVIPLGSAESLLIGEDLIMIGLPFGVDFLAVQGIVGSKDVSLSQLVWNHYYGANIYIAGGNSGTGVISTKQKALVGIITAGPGAQSSLAIFLPLHKIPTDKLRLSD